MVQSVIVTSPFQPFDGRNLVIIVFFLLPVIIGGKVVADLVAVLFRTATIEKP